MRVRIICLVPAALFAARQFATLHDVNAQARPEPTGDCAWIVPSDSAIRALLAERMTHNGVGIVVGIIDPSGRRVIAYGLSGASNDRLNS